MLTLAFALSSMGALAVMIGIGIEPRSLRVSQVLILAGMVLMGGSVVVSWW